MEEWVERLGHGTSSECANSLLVTRWKANTYVVLTPPSALPTLNLAHTLTRARWMAECTRAKILLCLYFAKSSVV